MAEALAAAFKDNLLKCSICLGEYEDPRVLPCYHTFCYGCIFYHSKRTLTQKRTFLCPVCREEIQFPVGGLTQLKKNFVLSKAKDIITQQQACRGALESGQPNIAAVTQAIAQMTTSSDSDIMIHTKALTEILAGMEKMSVPTPDTTTQISYSPGDISIARQEAMLGEMTVQSEPLRLGTDLCSATYPPVFLEKAKCVHSFSTRLKCDKTMFLNGLAIDKEHVFIVNSDSDSKYYRTNVFTHEGQFKFDIKLNDPFDVAVSQTGHLYITSQGKKCIKVYSTRGKKVKDIGLGKLEEPYGITLNRQGHVMVCDLKKKSIFTFHADSGQLLKIIPLTMCTYPAYITVNSVNDNVVVSDWGSDCVHVLSPTGNCLYQYGTQGSGDGQLWGSYGVCTDGYGHIFVADCQNHRIVALSPKGQFIRYIATGDDGLSYPRALDINPAGQLVVAEDNQVKTFQYLE
ncbi:tripartite motif-containing protein 3-like [Lingula anatina]|uniref:Tripartite motif-containing protein 3-like n=1 Tax=Lingula anatina TaxID=7574 RepID=A0A2R2MS57_LINAN|nr:tripartite motif-containing protein 3-like [Lingula anatina]|eukprot:XP_023933089.1 tripartite motif-containing protein 3-like [Lingula anatina]